MQGEEPTTCLVNTLGYEVGGEADTVVQFLLVLEGIVNLRIRHGTRVEPHIDEVKFTGEHCPTLAYQLDVVYIGTVQVYLVIILLRHVARHKALILQGVAFHHTGRNGLLYLVVKFLDRTDANLLACVAVAPDRQRRTPIA